MAGGSTKESEFDPEFSHTYLGEIPGLTDPFQSLYGHGDPEGDLARGESGRAWREIRALL